MIGSPGIYIIFEPFTASTVNSQLEAIVLKILLIAFTNIVPTNPGLIILKIYFNKI